MSVTVFCLNGRRQTMKTTPNTSILEILEFVCEKQGLNPQEYTLFRNNKQIDLSLTIRFANIPNNGQLDLKPATIKRKDEKVTVAIDLETGDRKVEQFDSNENLWNIIQQLLNNNPILNQNQDMNFCIVYMRKEIEGELTLKETSLRSLGLTNGKAAMRLIVRPKNASKEQAYVESLNLKKPSDSKEEPIDKPTVTHNTENITITQSTSTQKSSVPLFGRENVETPELKSNDSKLEEPLIRSNPISSDIPMSVNEETNSKNINQTETQEMEVENTDSSDESDDVINYLGGNNCEILFKLSDVSKLSNINISDDFFEITKDDLVYLLKDLQRQQVGNNDRSLETKQLRDQREKREKIDKYKSTVIRICFPNDKLVLQAVFKPNDNIDCVMQVIKNYIKENTKDFYLYTAPPKQQLKPDSTLYELKLVPAALIHFGAQSLMSGESVLKEELRDKVTTYKAAAKLALNTRKGANDWVSVSSDNSIANQSVRQELQSTSGSLNRDIISSGSGINRASNSADNQKDRKIPKWFKTNK